MKLFQGVLCLIVSIVCSPAPAQQAQQAYGVPIVGTAPPCASGLRCTDLTGKPNVLLGGYYSPGDYAGGYVSMDPSGCTDNGGTQLVDSAGNCFRRTDTRAAIPVQWFGARCDATTSVFGGSITAGTTAFTSTAPGVTFQPGDVGKTIELNYQSVIPFVTSITAVNTQTNTATLKTAAPNNYPGEVGATAADFSSTLEDGLDLPGAGYRPQDLLTVSCSTCGSSTAAEITVRATGLVGFGSTAGGSGYAAGDSIYFTALPATSYTTADAAEIQVQSVNGSGAVTGYTFISNGDFRPTANSITTNPQNLAISTSGSGSGFSVSLASGDASFGVAEVYSVPAVAGQYSAFPPLPSATSDSGTGSGATITLSFPTPTWTYGTDDTPALQKLEAFMETDYDRGIYNAAEVPGGHTCLLSTLEIQRPVSWRSSGSRQAELMQIMGSQGSTIDSTNYAFLLVAPGSNAADPYQGLSVGDPTVGFDNLSINGGSASQSVDVDGTTVTNTTDGILFTGRKPETFGLLQDFQAVAFPGNALAANTFGGALRGYNVFAGSSGGNCVDLENAYNPYRFYGLIASGCSNGIGINMAKSRANEFHGVSAFGNTVDVSLSGWTNTSGYVLFDGAQFGGSAQENLYLDQTNDTLICAANCYFNHAWKTSCPQAKTCGAIEVGPDAKNKATEQTPVIARFNQGLFASSPPYDVVFDNNPANNKPCNCRVVLGGGMVDVSTQGGNPGQPTTNVPSQLTGETTYAPPTFANAASVGVPLNLGPAEFGIGLSKDTESQPKGSGVKLRVECSPAHLGTARIVALAGSSPNPTIVADGIGTCP